MSKAKKRMFSLAHKLTGAFLVVGVIPLAVVACLAVWWMVQGFGVLIHQGQSALEDVTDQGAQALEETAYRHLNSLSASKAGEFQHFFKQRKADLQVLAHTIGVSYQGALRDLQRTCEVRIAPVEEYLIRCQSDARILSRSQEIHSVYDAFNAYYSQLKLAGLELDTSAPEYTTLFDQHSAYLMNYARQSGYYDFYIIADDGQVIFSSYREPDLGTNLKTGKFKDKGLAQTWAKACAQNSVVLSDFAPYSPSLGEESAFVAAPIRDEQYQVIGVLAIQITAESINNLMSGGNRDGVETFLIAQGKRKLELRSERGGDEAGDPVEEPFLGKALNQELSGMFPGKDGSMSLVAARPLKCAGLKWAMVAIRDAESALAPVFSGERQVKSPEWRNDFFGVYAETYGLQDLMLVAPEGQVLYSVARQADYHSDLRKAPWSQSPLASVVAEARTGFAFGDLARDESGDTPQSVLFLAKPVLDESGSMAMSIVVKMSPNLLSAVAREGTVVEKGLNCYLVGPHGLMRSDSVVYDEFVVGSEVPVDKGPVAEALAGKAGIGLAEDVKGHPVVSAYTPLNVYGTPWALVCEMDADRALAASKTMQASGAAGERQMQEDSLQARSRLSKMLAGAVLLVATLAIGFGLFTSQWLSGPIKRMLGQVLGSADYVEDMVIGLARTSKRQAQNCQSEAATLQQSSAGLTQMNALTQANAQAATECLDNMERTRLKIDSVSEGILEMKSVINKVQHSSDDTARIMRAIGDIAFQTNLLALNAAVEAARAGDAGKGFAVVAAEVRNLAVRCKEAAGETTDIMNSVQVNTRGSVKVVEQVISDLSALRAEEEQAIDKMHQITESSQAEATGIQELNDSVSCMAAAVQENAGDATQIEQASLRLKKEASDLHVSVDRLSDFIYSSRRNKSAALRETDPAQKPVLPLWQRLASWIRPSQALPGEVDKTCAGS